ncbi:MAG: LON peptidase substrate-binding domain-containing protein [Alphaproteobacteria bacterium]
MTGVAFGATFDELPREIGVFPLTGVLLLPGGKLPLNIFEPRYLAMTRDALTTQQRLIGMIQPFQATPDDNSGPTEAVKRGDVPDLYGTGCAGRITAFEESEDGRYLVTLTGIIRFNCQRELAQHDGYRRIGADYSNYRHDLGAAEDGEIERERLLSALRVYFEHAGISAQWDTIETTPNDRLVTSLAMSCPFNAGERQALLEAPDLAERTRVMVTLLEMAVAGATGGAGGTEH